MSAERIYWDGTAFLGWLRDEAGQAELCEGTIRRAEAAEILIVTSALTLAELARLSGGGHVPAGKADVLRSFFRHSYIRVRNLTRGIAEVAQDLVWDQAIRPEAAIHVATALDARCGVLETFDDALIGTSPIGPPLAGGGPGLIVRRPIAPLRGAASGPAH